MKKLRTLLNEIGYIGLVSKTGFEKRSPASSKHIKEDE
jgi:predicted xylose isomerase-like sugar epimerase